ncbi:LysR family transcriptional regulator [Solirhodobacter olei]|uniref:LysR family transcriptional regulator n=1 Tax=Solirhodobacter olei TaxID=2493082 RepID=UPI0013E3CF97|nr:LysR family transcriptional regulator [Solirhodobacter olei]
MRPAFALSPRQLEHFITVMNHRSLRAAAEAAGLTQPALSKSLAKLEDQLGVSLFQRTSKGVVPTVAARTLERHVKVMLADARYAAMEIEALRKGTSGTLRIGAGLIWSLGPLPRILSRLHGSYPQLQVEVRTGIAKPLLPLITSGDIDVFLGTVRNIDEILEASGKRDDLVIEPILKVQMLAFVRAGHPLLERGAVSAEDLASYPWAGFSGDDQQDAEVLEDFGNPSHSFPRCTLRTNSVAALLSIVSQSNHIILLADVLEREALSHGLKRVRHNAPTRTLETWLVTRQHLMALQPVNDLCAAIRGAAERQSHMRPVEPAEATAP